jgi:hypothetical protein
MAAVRALKVWYRRFVEGRSWPDEVPMVIRTHDELDAVVERVLADSRDDAVPSMIQVGVEQDRRAPVLEVGLGVDRGFVYYLSRDGGWTSGDRSLTGFVVYDYMANRREIPASVEIPIDGVRRRLRDFMTTPRVPEGLFMPPEHARGVEGLVCPGVGE